MKLSAYYKSIGADVELKLDYKNLDTYDKVTISKVFTDTPIDEKILTLSNVEYGGTGFYYDKAPRLSDNIEHIMPDYHLYDEWVKQQLDNSVKAKELTYYTDYSIGFTTRGCIRQCAFCVNKNYKKCELHSPLSEFVDESRPYICLLDDNILACPKWRDVFNELAKTGKRFQFKQGVDERLLTDEKCKVLFNCKWIGDRIFAFDNIKDKDIIINRLEMIRRHTNQIIKFYCFCGFNHNKPDSYDDVFYRKDIEDLFERINILMKYRCLPYVMRYKDYVNSPYRGIYITVARWCNQPSFFKKMSFKEFCKVNGENSSAYRYMTDFEKEHPDISKKYFNMKWGD